MALYGVLQMKFDSVLLLNIDSVLLNQVSLRSWMNLSQSEKPSDAVRKAQSLACFDL